MRFVDLLNNAAWTATYRGVTLDAPGARRLVEHAAQRLQNAQQAAQDALRLATGTVAGQQLTVFCAFTPLETLLCYCIASRLGLLAAVLSPRTLPRFLDDVGPGLAVRLVAPAGHKLPDAVASYGALLLDLSPEAATDASCEALPASPQECGHSRQR